MVIDLAQLCTHWRDTAQICVNSNLVIEQEEQAPTKPRQVTSSA
jgi:hypothetical protein